VQYKSSSGQFQDYVSNAVDVSEKPVIEPDESYCYAYDIPFEPINEDKVKYRNSVSVTILNHSGWLPGSNHCEGPDPCPFGPDPKDDFSLPEPVIPTTTLSAQQSASGFIDVSEEGETFYGAKGDVCVTNQGEYATENLGIYAVVENRTGDDYKENAAQTLNTNEYPVIAPGETYCYPFEISFPDPDENVIEPRVITTVTISNHIDWMPGDASCPGPEVCYHGPTLETRFEIPVTQTILIPVTEEPPKPEPGTSLSATETATGFVEECEGETIRGVRGDLCVKNEGLNSTDGLSITDSIQSKAVEDESEFVELNTVVIDLSQYPVITPEEPHCYPYEIFFEPPEGENVQYRNVVEIKINNYVDWLPGSANCAGPESCPFGVIAFADFTFPDDPPTTETPPTETPPTETLPPTEPPLTELPPTETPPTETPPTEPPYTEPTTTAELATDELPATPPPPTEAQPEPQLTEAPAIEPPATETPVPTIAPLTTEPSSVEPPQTG
jgi:hypothetical protein